MFKFFELISSKEKSMVNNVTIIYSLSNLFDLLILTILPLLIANIINFDNENLVLFEKYLFFFFNYEELNRKERVYLLLISFLLLSSIKFFYSIYAINKVTILFSYFKKTFTYRAAKKYFQKDYIFLKSQNKPDFVRAVTVNTDLVLINAFIPLVSLIADLIATLPIVILILILDFKLFLFIMFFFSFFIFLYNKYVRKKFISIGAEANKYEILRQRYASDLFASIITILSNSSFEEYIKKPLAVTVSAAQRDQSVYFFQLITKHIVEFFFVLIIFSVFIFCIFFFENLKDIIFILGMYTLASFKLLPIINRTLNNLQLIKYSSDFCLKLINLMSKQNETGITLKEKKKLKKISLINTIKVSNIFFSYNDKKIFKNFSCEFKKNKISLIYGKSGSGKTTLIELILGMLKIEKGKIEFNDISIWNLNLKYILNKISFLPQSPYLINDSLKKNLVIGNKKKINDHEIIQTLNLVGLSDIIRKEKYDLNFILNSGADILSGGQKQRVAIARSILTQPNFLILDEPTSGLDEQNTKILITTLSKLKKKMGIIVISHDIKSFSKILDYKIKI